MKINGLATYKNDVENINNDYFKIIEDSLYVLKTKKKEVRAVEPYLTHKYKSDFYGLLTELKVPVPLHYATLRINDMKNPNEYLGDENFIYIVNESYLNALFKMHEAS